MSLAAENRRDSWNETQLNLGRAQADVLHVIRNHPQGIGPWKVAEILGTHAYAVRPRFTELSSLGLITEIGKNQDTPTGKAETVYRARSVNSNGLIELF